MSFCLNVTWLTAPRNSNGLSFCQMLSFILIFQRKQICGSYCTTTRASWAVDRRMDGQALFTSAPARLPRTKNPTICNIICWFASWVSQEPQSCSWWYFIAFWIRILCTNVENLYINNLANFTNDVRVERMLGQMTCRPSIWCSKYYFFFIISCKILCVSIYFPI